MSNLGISEEKRNKAINQETDSLWDYYAFSLYTDADPAATIWQVFRVSKNSASTSSKLKQWAGGVDTYRWAGTGLAALVGAW